MFQVGNSAEECDFIPPPCNGLSAVQRVASGCHDIPLVRVMKIADGVSPGVGCSWSEANETALDPVVSRE